jgi:hypothetical protein
VHKYKRECLPIRSVVGTEPDNNIEQTQKKLNRIEEEKAVSDIHSLNLYKSLI